MSKEVSTIVRFAKKLVSRLPEEIDNKLRLLVARAEEGRDTTTEIIDLLTLHENSMLWILEQVDLPRGQEDTIRGYGSLAGNPSASFSQKWICPRKGCTESLPVIQEGEDPPVCDWHKINMVRENDGKEHRYA